MINRLFTIFRDLVDDNGTARDQQGEQTIQMAAAALMLEVARSDTAKQDAELTTIETILLDEFGIDSDQVKNLMAAADEKVELAHDLYQFTQLVNEQYRYEEKQQLIFAMWRVAFADGHIEAIEDHIIRRVAGLLHLAHEDFIQSKIQARDSQ